MSAPVRFVIALTATLLVFVASASIPNEALLAAAALSVASLSTLSSAKTLLENDHDGDVSRDDAFISVSRHPGLEAVKSALERAAEVAKSGIAAAAEGLQRAAEAQAEAPVGMGHQALAAGMVDFTPHQPSGAAEEPLPKPADISQQPTAAVQESGLQSPEARPANVAAETGTAQAGAVEARQSPALQQPAADARPANVVAETVNAPALQQFTADAPVTAPVAALPKVDMTRMLALEHQLQTDVATATPAQAGGMPPLSMQPSSVGQAQILTVVGQEAQPAGSSAGLLQPGSLGVAEAPGSISPSLQAGLQQLSGIAQHLASQAAEATPMKASPQLNLVSDQQYVGMSQPRMATGSGPAVPTVGSGPAVPLTPSGMADVLLPAAGAVGAAAGGFVVPQSFVIEGQLRPASPTRPASLMESSSQEDPAASVEELEKRINARKKYPVGEQIEVPLGQTADASSNLDSKLGSDSLSDPPPKEDGDPLDSVKSEASEMFIEKMIKDTKKKAKTKCTAMFGPKCKTYATWAAVAFGLFFFCSIYCCIMTVCAQCQMAGIIIAVVCIFLMMTGGIAAVKTPDRP